MTLSESSEATAGAQESAKICLEGFKVISKCKVFR